MAIHQAELCWERADAAFVDNRYSRRHRVRFDGGVELVLSSSPHVVPEPYSDPQAVDPEELFVASLASCHLLWFLSIAAGRGYRVDRYVDAASGVLAPDDDGELAITEVTLRPAVWFSGDVLPAPADIEALHHAAHARCFLARSVKSVLHCRPVIPAV